MVSNRRGISLFLLDWGVIGLKMRYGRRQQCIFNKNVIQLMRMIEFSAVRFWPTSQYIFVPQTDNVNYTVGVRTRKLPQIDCFVCDEPFCWKCLRESESAPCRAVRFCIVTTPTHRYFFNYIIVKSQWAPWRLKSPASRLFARPIVLTHIEENTKHPRYWPLWGEYTGDWWVPLTKGQWRGKCFHPMTSSWTKIAQIHREIRVWMNNYIHIDRDM